MDTTIKTPETLQEAILYFGNPTLCVAYAASLRWPDGKPVCPKCGGTDHYFITSRHLWKCKACAKQFSVKVGTIFEDSAIGLDKWMTAMWMISGCKNGISSYEIGRDLGVSQKTAWFMLQRIRKVMQGDTTTKLAGDVEVDESFIGGKARNMHKGKREQKITGRGPAEGKTIVAAVLERHGEVRATVVPTRRKKPLQEMVRDHVATGSNLYSDALKSYEGLDGEFVHQVIDHAEAYVDGQIHTNGLENFWALLKRGLKGTYIAVEPYHLFRYLDEQCMRYNHRHLADAERFEVLMKRISGRRLTWDEVTGKKTPMSEFRTAG